MEAFIQEFLLAREATTIPPAVPPLGADGQVVCICHIARPRPVALCDHQALPRSTLLQCEEPFSFFPLARGHVERSIHAGRQVHPQQAGRSCLGAGSSRALISATRLPFSRHHWVPRGRKSIGLPTYERRTRSAAAKIQPVRSRGKLEVVWEVARSPVQFSPSDNRLSGSPTYNLQSIARPCVC